MSEISTNDKYNHFLEELKATLVEGVFSSRMALIEAYHKVGELIFNSSYEVLAISEDSGISERTLQRSVQFYKKYPLLDLLPDGKNISWHKIVNKYLPEGGEEPSHRDVSKETATCPFCGGRFEL